MPAHNEPVVVYGGRYSPGNTGLSPRAGISLFVGGFGLLDPRYGYNVTGVGAVGWAAVGDMIILDAAPSTLSTVAIAAAQVPVANTKLTLVAASGAGITVVTAATQAAVIPSLSVPPVGALVIDGLPGTKTLGLPLIQSSLGLSYTNSYDPTKAIARNVQIASVGNDSTATFLVSGADLYGYPMTETITGANAGTAAGKKAFKFVYTITPAGTLSGANVSVGQGDIYGFPFRLDDFFYSTIFWNGALITATTGFLPAVTTSPATSTTGDTRGTYAVQSASNGTKRLQILAIPSVANLNASPLYVGFTGVTPA